MRLTLQKAVIGIAALLLSLGAYAQDIILTTEAQKIEAKITEVSKSEIRYKEKDYPDGPTFVLPTDEINSIIYANGKVVLYNQTAAKPEPKQESTKQSSAQSPIAAPFAQPEQPVMDESLAQIQLLSGALITAKIVSLRKDGVTYLLQDEESTLPASQIEKVTFLSNGQVKAYNMKDSPVARPKQPSATLASAPQTSGRIYRDNNEYMHNNRYISSKEVARILEREDYAAYKQWKKADGFLIGGSICAGIGSGLVLGGLISLVSGSPVPCIAMECCALAPLGIGIGLCVGANSKYNKAIDIYNSKYDKTTMQLQWRLTPNGVGLAIAF